MSKAINIYTCSHTHTQTHTHTHTYTHANTLGTYNISGDILSIQAGYFVDISLNREGFWCVFSVQRAYVCVCIKRPSENCKCQYLCPWHNLASQSLTTHHVLPRTPPVDLRGRGRGREETTAHTDLVRIKEMWCLVATRK